MRECLHKSVAADLCREIFLRGVDFEFGVILEEPLHVAGIFFWFDGAGGVEEYSAGPDHTSRIGHNIALDLNNFREILWLALPFYIRLFRQSSESGAWHIGDNQIGRIEGQILGGIIYICLNRIQAEPLGALVDKPQPRFIFIDGDNPTAIAAYLGQQE